MKPHLASTSTLRRKVRLFLGEKLSCLNFLLKRRLKFYSFSAKFMIYLFQEINDGFPFHFMLSSDAHVWHTLMIYTDMYAFISDPVIRKFKGKVSFANYKRMQCYSRWIWYNFQSILKSFEVVGHTLPFLTQVLWTLEYCAHAITHTPPGGANQKRTERGATKLLIRSHHVPAFLQTRFFFSANPDEDWISQVSSRITFIIETCMCIKIHSAVAKLRILFERSLTSSDVGKKRAFSSECLWFRS